MNLINWNIDLVNWRMFSNLLNLKKYYFFNKTNYYYISRKTLSETNQIIKKWMNYFIVIFINKKRKLKNYSLIILHILSLFSIVKSKNRIRNDYCLCSDNYFINFYSNFKRNTTLNNVLIISDYWRIINRILKI
jgi:hypothetical protein